ncbi:lysosomal acid phosphatase-like [Contarinia nasturtii]|uniref:lysosomal acid phosphatase-like n=1 Tax=Contarinia nasturtii TaxID=265458 RepID=UPI0012D48AFC|nr:lysosomal acid phosphatase-like [Contarinia nasturtii]
MSAELLAAGMFPPSGNEIWNDELDWQPIPIHTKHISQDYVHGYFNNCPQYEQLYRKFTESPEFKYQFEKNIDFVRYLELNSGLKLLGTEELMYLIDRLRMEKEKCLVLSNSAFTSH